MIASVEKGNEHRNAVLEAVCAASCVGREYTLTTFFAKIFPHPYLPLFSQIVQLRSVLFR